MATIKYNKERQRWIVTYWEGNLRKRMSFVNEKVAKPFHAEKQYEEECLDVGKTPFKPLPFEDAAELFLTEWFVTKSPSYKESETRRVRALKPHFKSLCLHQIGSDRLLVFYRWRLSEGVAEKTAHSDMIALHNMFTWGMKRKPHRFCKTNPVKELDLGKPTPQKKRRAAQPGEVEAILAASCPCCVVQIELLLETGLRVGEMVQLSKEDFNLESHVLDLRHSEKLRLKHGTSGRVPLSDRAEQLVRALPPGPLLKLSRTQFHKHWAKTRTRAKSDLCLHELRHTYITKQFEAGVPANYVKDFARHRDMKTTLGYAHQSDEVAAMYRNAAAKSYLPAKSLTSNVHFGNSSVQVQTLADQVLAELTKRIRTLDVTTNERETGFEYVSPESTILKNQELIGLITEICGEMLLGKKLRA